MGAIAIPESMKLWCSGLWDFGKLGNTDTGYIGELQLHATITNSSAIAGLGFHLSAYALGGGGYVLSDFKPENAFAKSYYYPGALASGLCYMYQGRDNWGPNVATITGMPVYQRLLNEGWAYFLEINPTYKLPVKPPTLSSDDFPGLPQKK